LDALEEKVAEFIGRHGLFAGARRVLLAVSGGADSIALLGVLTSLRREGLLGAELICAHVNHGLRGPAGDEDEAFVTEQAGRSKLPVTTARVDVREYASKHRLSVETAARQLRLERLCATARQHGCSWIATGHQKNDNAETVVHRLWRGTGFRGLAGIWPGRQFDNGIRFARPMLCVTRDEIRAYLNARNVTWRQDHTNADPAYTRNLIRHQLLPALGRTSTGVLVEALSELATAAHRLGRRIARETETAQRTLTKRRHEQTRLAAHGLANLAEPVAVELIRRELVHLGCGERDLSREHYRNILRLARQRTAGKATALPQGFSARRCGDTILLMAPPDTHDRAGIGKARAPVPLQIPGTTRCGWCRIKSSIVNSSEIERQKIEGDRDPFCEYLDCDRIAPGVVVRPRRPGDRFRPLGMADEKKVGKFLTTAKVPRAVRKDVLVLDDGVQIIWVCPVRIGERVKVTKDTRRVLQLKVIPVRHRERKECEDCMGDCNHEEYRFDAS